jgi:hypothetical protein
MFGKDDMKGDGKKKMMMAVVNDNGDESGWCKYVNRDHA